MLLGKEDRNCRTGLNLWTSVSGTPLAAASSQCFSRSWVQLSPTSCHRSWSPLLQRREEREKFPPDPAAGSASDPKHKYVTQRASWLVQLPVSLTSMKLLSSLEKKPRAFRNVCLSLLQQPVPRSCNAASNLWERL